LFSWFYLTPSPSETRIAAIDFVEKPSRSVTEIQLIDSRNNELIIQGDNPVISLDKDGGLSINSERIEKAQSKAENKSQQPQYNQLITPSGKRSFLILSDGTKIWVNANSRVVYPNIFEKDKREILVEGEAFLKVTPDTERPFYVRTQAFSIKVLGTSFNVSAYEADKDVSVVLVTGKVDIDTKNNLHKTLSPNEMLSFRDGKMETKTVNTDDYVSWIKGSYTFNGEKFSVILNKLSRYYGKAFSWDPEVENLHCSGSLNLKDDIYKLLEGIETAVPVVFIEKENLIEVSLNSKNGMPMK
jgi:ferric-dicitrate binding protein FerR (iron transport regulator)